MADLSPYAHRGGLAACHHAMRKTSATGVGDLEATQIGIKLDRVRARGNDRFVIYLF